jgi:L-ascorbate metabolism protein UlaG (beta-lactamase superfamily)
VAGEPAGRLRYVGHATVLLEPPGARLLTDPVLRARVGHVRRVVPAPAIAELPPLDGILVSHAHADHLDLPSLRRVAGAAPVLAPLGCGRLLRRAGVASVVEMSAGERRALGSSVVEAVPARHDGRRHPLGARMAALGYVVETSPSIYFAGDTDLFPEMADLAGRVDVALLPIAGWGPRLPAGHLDPRSAARAVALIRPRVAVPIHWGTMRSLGTRAPSDPRAPALSFAAAVAELAPSVDVRILDPGETMSLSA